MHQIISGLRIPTALAIVAGITLIVSGCGSKHRLAEYDFRGRTLAVVTIAPPYPELLSGTSLETRSDNPLETFFRVGSEIAREVSARQLRTRLDSAATAVDVSGRMGERALHNAARHLRASPVMGSGGGDHELEIRVRHYGIVATSWTAGAYFSIDADVFLLDGRTGRRIWNTHVRRRDPVGSSTIGVDDRSVSNVVTAVTLSNMSTDEIKRALESLADYAADRVVEQLAKSLDDVRR
jgi:hypothetical protein